MRNPNDTPLGWMSVRLPDGGRSDFAVWTAEEKRLLESHFRFISNLGCVVSWIWYPGITASAGTGGTGQSSNPVFPALPWITEGEEESPSVDVPEKVRELCPLCSRKIGLNKNSPFLAYNDSPRVRHLMDVHKRTLEEAQDLIKRHHGR